MKIITYLTIVFSILLSCNGICTHTLAQNQNGSTGISDFVADMSFAEGYIDYYWDHNDGKIWLMIDELQKEFLYVSALPAGVGSNDIGLDRGQLGTQKILKFYRSGPKLLLVQPNYQFRASSDNPDEQKSVQEAFAQSVIWGFTIEKEEEGKVLVDATEFFLRDAHGVAERLQKTNQGSYKLEPGRSAIYVENCKNFPENTEIEAMITFIGDDQGNYIRQVAPDAESITVRMHHSFIKLPDNAYQPRVFDPRAGYFNISYHDYATPLGQSIKKRLIARHRLVKKDPNATISEAVEPIIYYVDRGAPEPIRSALIEGASWWNEAFEAAGFKNAFQVKLLPEGVDPLDVRYNVIQWVHRATRGWSYGSAVIDPRTGEIIKGHVSLGSLRIRQDMLIATGLLGPYEGDDQEITEVKEMALARLRQLSAHEVGHTLGMAHNFAASANQRASVMDYPHPLISLKNDRIDLSNAYDTGIGAWDKFAIRYGYSQFKQEEKQELNRIIDQYIREGLLYITDQDARPLGGAHSYAHLWDNGENPSTELQRILNIRKHVLNEFGHDRIAKGNPVTTMQEVLAPIYFMPRYQIEAVAKMIAGKEYSYAVKGSQQIIQKDIPANLQRQALERLLQLLQPEQLAIPEHVLELLAPRVPGYPSDRETFKGRTDPIFDELSAAETLAEMVLNPLFHPARVNRLVNQQEANSDLPGFNEMLNQVIDATWKAPKVSGRFKNIQINVQSLVLKHMMQLYNHEMTADICKSIVFRQIRNLKMWIAQQQADDTSWISHFQHNLFLIEQFLENPMKTAPVKILSPPDGSPIGHINGCSW